MAADDKAVIGQTHGTDDPEAISVPGAPSIGALHAEYIERGGRFYACPVCVKSRGLESAEWVQGAEVKGAPSLFEFTQGGALTFNY